MTTLVKMPELANNMVKYRQVLLDGGMSEEHAHQLVLQLQDRVMEGVIAGMQVVAPRAQEGHMGEYERKDRQPERLSEPENAGGLREVADEVQEGDQRPLQEGEPADGPDVEDVREAADQAAPVKPKE